MGGPINHPLGGEKAERYNYTLPPHNGKEFHRGPIGQYVRTWRLHAHSSNALRKLVPCGIQGTSRPLIQGVYGGLVQDKCGLGDINIDFLSHSSLLALVDRPPIRLAVKVTVNHFHLWVPKRRSVLLPGAHTRTREATLARAAYLRGLEGPVLFRR